MSRRYFIHPESACAWFTDDPEIEYTDPLVVEVDHEEFLKARAAYGEDTEE